MHLSQIRLKTNEQRFLIEATVQPKWLPKENKPVGGKTEFSKKQIPFEEGQKNSSGLRTHGDGREEQEADRKGPAGFPFTCGGVQSDAWPIDLHQTLVDVFLPQNINTNHRRV